MALIPVIWGVLCGPEEGVAAGVGVWLVLLRLLRPVALPAAGAPPPHAPGGCRPAPGCDGGAHVLVAPAAE